MILFLANVFLLPVVMIVAFVLLFVTGRTRYLAILVVIALVKYIYWLYFSWRQFTQFSHADSAS